VTDAEYRATLIASGAIVPYGARRAVFAQDYEGRRVAARDIFYEEGPRVAAAVAANPYADQAVRRLLQKALDRHEDDAA